MFKSVNPKNNFATYVDDINKFWKKHKIFEKSVSQRPSDNKFVFYDGPPFITGTPHYGSLLPTIAKDVIPRFQTMRGKKVERVWGWDAHGLPIENKVEKNLGIKNRREIETFGIGKFIEACYEYTQTTSAEWRWYIDKIGRWVDFDNPYRTMDQDYMESVMWTFKEIYAKDFVYQGLRTSLFCTRCGTPVSNFEIAMDNSYADMEDPAVTIKFPLLEGAHKGANVLAWTTTPWTLPSNKALVVDPAETYVKAEVTRLGLEIEQSFIINELPDEVKKAKKSQITQAYLADYTDEHGVKVKDARVRKKDGKFEFTLKYFADPEQKEFGVMKEINREISEAEFIEFVKKATSKVVKTRYYVALEDGLTAEVDVYQNNLDGIVTAEVEFENFSQIKNFKKPAWFGNEVTDSYACYPPYMTTKTVEELKNELASFVQPAHDYEKLIVKDEIIFAKKRSEYVLKGADYKIVEEFLGDQLLNTKYEPPFGYFEAKDIEHRIYSFDGMVHMEEGSGVVHSAPGFGDIDTEMGNHHGLGMAMSIGDDGKYLPIVADYEGIYVKEADPKIIEDLQRRNLLYRHERITHRYPFCYRCETPLIHKAQPSWYINVQKLKSDLVNTNENINWVPDHLKNGRFKKGIEVAPDWGVSRTRFWAAPMPVWQGSPDETGNVERVVIGSRDELREKSVAPITKITFVRHGDNELGDPDGDLTETGFAQAKDLANKLATEKIDAIYYSNYKRTFQTIEFVAAQTGLTPIQHELFGNEESRAAFIAATKQIPGELENSDEGTVRKAFESHLGAFSNQMSELLKKHAGQNIVVATHREILVLLKHLYEKFNLRDALLRKYRKGEPVTMYFVQDKMLDLHRPMIDEIKIKGQTGELTRIPEVLDVWMDSASMPYAAKHYPFADKADFEANFPADFVVEYIAQTRAWFYVMHVVSNALMKTNPFKNVLTTGVISGTDGRKMSKSYGNYPDPKKVLETIGPEALRLYLMGSKVMIGGDINFDEAALRDQVQTILLPIWNSYSFFVTYANLHNWKTDEIVESNDKLDIWIKSKQNSAAREMIVAFEDYDIPAATRQVPIFVSDLSKWYIRRSRDRFAQGDKEALSTLYTVLLDLAKMIAPLAPFLAEEIYQNLAQDLAGKSESVHLCDYPQIDTDMLENTARLCEQMDHVREVVNIGQSLRIKNSLKVRQPLAELEVVAELDAKRDWDFEIWMKDLIADELNVKKVDEVKSYIEKDAWVFAKSETSSMIVALDTQLTEALKDEGQIRELCRLIQDQRKKQGFSIDDKPGLIIYAEDADTKNLIERSEQTILDATNSSKVSFAQEADMHQILANGQTVWIKLE